MSLRKTGCWQDTNCLLWDCTLHIKGSVPLYNFCFGYCTNQSLTSSQRICFVLFFRRVLTLWTFHKVDTVFHLGIPVYTLKLTQLCLAQGTMFSDSPTFAFPTSCSNPQRQFHLQPKQLLWPGCHKSPNKQKGASWQVWSDCWTPAPNCIFMRYN